MMTDVGAWLLRATVELSIIVAIILLIREPLQRMVGARWVYLLWLIPGVRLLLSVVPEGIRGTFAFALPESMQLPATNAAWVNMPTMPVWLVATLVSLWLAGCAMLAVLLIRQQLQATRELIGQSQPLEPDQQKRINRYCERLRVFPTLDGRTSALVTGPLLLGLWRPVLLIPKGFFETCPEPELAVRHELVHFQRRDLAWNLLGAIIQCIFWFNPLIHRALRRFRDDQEIACDCAVLVDESGLRRSRYGLAMLQASGPRLAGTVGFMDTSPSVKQRTRLIVEHRTRPLRQAAGATVLAVLMVAAMTMGVDAAAYDLEWALTFPAHLPGGCQ